jgi:hypothetical protein
VILAKAALQHLEDIRHAEAVEADGPKIAQC